MCASLRGHESDGAVLFGYSAKTLHDYMGSYHAKIDYHSPMSTESEDRDRQQPYAETVGATIPQASSQPARPASAPQVVVAIFTVLAACYFAKIVFVVLLVSILLAFILTPLVEILERFRLNRSVAALIVLLLIGAAVYGLSYYSYSKAMDFIQDLPKYSSRFRHAVARFQQKAEDLQKSTLPAGNEQKKAVNGEQGSKWAEWLAGVG